MHAEVTQRLDPKLTDVNGPILLSDDIRRLVGTDDDAYHVLSEINARKPIHTVYNVGHHFMHEVFASLVSAIERGRLGLRMAAA
jgi:flavine halogenase